MGQQNVLIPYETIAAYNASQGIALYNGDSGQNSDVNFHVNWDPDGGFTGNGWDEKNPYSPAYPNTPSEISDELGTSGNLDNLFETWHSTVDAANRLKWIMEHSSCVQ